MHKLREVPEQQGLSGRIENCRTTDERWSADYGHMQSKD